jgi:hypothetical protein
MFCILNSIRIFILRWLQKILLKLFFFPFFGRWKLSMRSCDTGKHVGSQWMEHLICCAEFLETFPMNYLHFRSKVGFDQVDSDFRGAKQQKLIHKRNQIYWHQQMVWPGLNLNLQSNLTWIILDLLAILATFGLPKKQSAAQRNTQAWPKDIDVYCNKGQRTQQSIAETKPAWWCLMPFVHLRPILAA